MVKNTHLIWHCYHCGHQHRYDFHQQFQANKTYGTNWKCSKCSKKTHIHIKFSIGPEKKVA